MREFLCVCVEKGRQFVMDVLALSADDAFEKVEAMGYECFCVSEIE